MKNLKQPSNNEKNKQKVTDFFSMRVMCTLLMVLKTFIKILKNGKKKRLHDHYLICIVKLGNHCALLIIAQYFKLLLPG